MVIRFEGRQFPCNNCCFAFHDEFGLQNHLRVSKRCKRLAETKEMKNEAEIPPETSQRIKTKTNVNKQKKTKINVKKLRMALQKSQQRNVVLARKVAQLEEQHADFLANKTSLLLSEQNAAEIPAKKCRNAEKPSNETLKPGTDYLAPIIKATPEDMTNFNDFYVNKIVATGKNAFGIVKVRAVFVDALPL